MTVQCRFGCIMPDGYFEQSGYHFRKLTEEDCINRAKRIFKDMNPGRSDDWLRANFKLQPGYDSYRGTDVAIEECPVARRRRTTEVALRAHNADLLNPLPGEAASRSRR